MKTAVIIQARMGSTRLPGKVLVDLAGMPVLWHVIQRVSCSGLPDEILVATTINPEDDLIESACREWGIKVWRGDPDDVLSRYYDGMLFLERFHTRIDYIVRVTADCPMIDPVIIDESIRAALSGGFDYVSNIDPPSYPDGLDVEVISRFALIESCKNAALLSEREHVTPYIRNNPRFTRFNIRNFEDQSDLRWTLDTENDLIFIRKIYSDLYRSSKIFSTSDVTNYLQKNPDIQRINTHIKRNEGYAKSLHKDTLFQMVKK